MKRFVIVIAGDCLGPFVDNDFERNAKEWTRDNVSSHRTNAQLLRQTSLFTSCFYTYLLAAVLQCARQYPHRKNHPSGGHFPEEGWGGKCGNNELTCHMSGFGAEGKISFDW